MLTYPPVKKVSVVIPVYNEQDSLPELLRRTDTACATLEHITASQHIQRVPDTTTTPDNAQLCATALL